MALRIAAVAYVRQLSCSPILSRRVGVVQKFVADDYVGSDAEVVRVHLLDDVGVFDIRRCRPRLQAVLRILEHIGPAALELRAGSSVHQKHVAIS